MSKANTNTAVPHEAWEDPLTVLLRPVLSEAIQDALDGELRRALGAERYARVTSRVGYRNGTEPRELGTPLGPVKLEVPRARVTGPDGSETEWRSDKLPRHARRMRGIDRAVVSIYLSGTNQRRIAAALRPLLKGLPLSKSSVSRLAARLQQEREAWLTRELSGEGIVYVYLDGFGVDVRRDGRVVRNPILMAIGVRENGDKVLLAMRIAGGESTAAWRGLVEDLAARGLRAPALCLIDGSAGLRAAVAATWPEAAVQRCTVHKLRNLLSHAPKHAHESLAEDYHRIVYGRNGAEAAAAYARFLTRWRKRCAAVATSLEDGGPELLTFYRFPKEQWKSLRTTNIIERVNAELRRRIKTQAAWNHEEALLNLLFGLFASGQIRLRRLAGYRTLAVQPIAGQPKAA